MRWRQGTSGASDGAALYQGIVDAAAAVTGARYVNLSWLAPDGWIRGSAWAMPDAALMDRVLTAARYVVPGFDPMAVRFRSDVNAAVRRVLVEGRPHFAPFAEHVEGTVHPMLARIAQTTVGLQWTHSVPLVISGQIAGSLAFHWPDRPHPRTLSVAEAFSSQVALTLENVRLSEALRARAKDLERSRERLASAAETTRREIAETLDKVGSRILVATQRLLGCRALLASSPPYAAAELSRIAEELDHLRDDDVRAASHRLHPSLISIGLVPALEMLADSFGGLDVRITASPGVTALDDIARNALPLGTRLAAYRFVEDTVAGLATSGEARSARVAVGIQGGALRTAVVDEGGRALGSLPLDTLGAISDRIERVDGAIEIESGDGEASVTAIVPLPESASRPDKRGGATDLFQTIADNALAVTGARMVSLSWHDEGDEVLEFGALAPFGALTRMLEAARRIVPGFDLSQMRFRVDLNRAVRTVFVEGRALLAPTTEHAAGVVNPTVLRVGMAMLGFRWTYSVPLRVDGAVAGALAFHVAERPASATLAVADVFASQAALTLANERLAARLRDRVGELGASRERIAAAEERVRRDVAELLHGRVQARLLVVAHRVLDARVPLASDLAAADATLEELATELDRIREDELRQAIDQLHPAVIDVSLMAALRDLAEDLGPKLDVTVTASEVVEALDDPARNAVPEPVRLAIYRTVEEALANVARHAQTSAAAVRVEIDGGRFRTTVSDAGRGYDAATARAGVGLRSMRDRVESLGGALSIVCAPGRGTTVTLTLPLERHR